METTTAASAESAAAEATAAGKATHAATNAVRVPDRSSRRPAGVSGVARLVARSEVMGIAAPSVTVASITETPIAEAAESSKRHPRGVEAPAERVEKDAVVRNEGISAIRRIPIPSIAVPHARRRAAWAGIRPGRIHIGFRQIRGPQAGPPVEIVGVRILVEFLCLQLSGGVEHELVIARQLNVFVAGLRHRFSVEHADRAPIRIEVVQARL